MTTPEFSPPRTIFAVDSAGKTASVALWNQGALAYESYLAAGHTHSETLLALCDAAFRATNTTPAQIDLFAVNAGPGSFTGLRIGLALVKGLALPFHTRCAPVSTLHAMACSACNDGLVACALDARRGEVYCALFARKHGMVTRITPDDTLPAATFAAQALSHRAQAAAIEGTPLGCFSVCCMGDGASLVLQAAQAAETAAWFTLYPAPQRFGRASGICLAALALCEEGACVDAQQLVPAYHRLSQAERERAARCAQ